MGQICEILDSAGIYLKQVAIDAFKDPRVFKYLASFQGLEQIFLFKSKLSDGISSELINYFFTSVLPSHSNSLRRLKIGGDCMTEWSLPLEERYKQSIAKCQKLEYVCCWILIRPEDVDVNNAEVLVRYFLPFLLDNLPDFLSGTNGLAEGVLAPSQAEAAEMLCQESRHDNECDRGRV
ncbi:hypothetical protein AN958_00170 [Leucoagaricus sp. SymC.cos]|nr:hypothetical protein AN958_00170 [Leucoagaricus sp. SymC.cos]